MAHLTLNGVTVSVAVESGGMTPEDIGGEEMRSQSGALSGGPAVVKRSWRMTTTPIPPAEVDAWTGLVEGRGHSFPYNADLYSARGRGPSYTGSAALVVGGAKYGAAYLRVGTSDDVLYNLTLTSGWTVMLWRLESGTWRHYLVTSTGAKWKDGVRNDALSMSGIFSVNGSGQLRVGDTGGVTGVRDFDDVVAMPYAMPVAWAAAFYTQHSGAAWSSLPRLSAAGSFASAAVTVRGKVTSAPVVRFSSGGALVSGNRLEFTLKEV